MTTDETPRPTRRGKRGGRKHRTPKLGPAGDRDLCPTPRKVAHHTEGAADRHVAELAAAGKTLPGDGTIAYRCQCGAWHVGRDRTKATRRVNGRSPVPASELLDVKLGQLAALYGRPSPIRPGRRP